MKEKRDTRKKEKKSKKDRSPKINDACTKRPRYTI
jgi:hypothetical protein